MCTRCHAFQHPLRISRALASRRARLRSARRTCDVAGQPHACVCRARSFVSASASAARSHRAIRGGDRQRNSCPLALLGQCCADWVMWLCSTMQGSTLCTRRGDPAHYRHSARSLHRNSKARADISFKIMGTPRNHAPVFGTIVGQACRLH